MVGGREQGRERFHERLEGWEIPFRVEKKGGRVESGQSMGPAMYPAGVEQGPPWEGGCGKAHREGGAGTQDQASGGIPEESADPPEPPFEWLDPGSPGSQLLVQGPVQARHGCSQFSSWASQNSAHPGAPLCF